MSFSVEEAVKLDLQPKLNLACVLPTKSTSWDVMNYDASEICAKYCISK